MKNILLIIVALGLLFAAFLLLDKKQENQNMIQAWDLNLKSISYKYSPKENAGNGDSDYPQEEFTIRKEASSTLQEPILIYSRMDKESGKEIQYEAGYNGKNLFRDMAQLKVSSLIPSTDEVLEDIDLTPDAPVVTLLTEGGESKRLILAPMESSDDNALFEADGKILTAQSFIFKRFQLKPIELRERQLVPGGNLKIETIRFTGEGEEIAVENHPYHNGQRDVNSWRRISGMPILLDPQGGDKWMNLVYRLRASVYADEENGQGLAVGEVLTGVAADSMIDIGFSNGRTLQLRFYPPTQFEGRKYRPSVRIWKGIFKSSPLYIPEEDYQLMLEQAKWIEKAKAYKEPKKEAQPK